MHLLCEDSNHHRFQHVSGKCEDRTYWNFYMHYIFGSKGDGKSGGKCHSETVPDFRSSYSLSKSWSHFLNPFTEQLMQNSTRSALKEIDVLNVTEMTAQRKDGHQSLYHVGPLSDARRLHKEDCSHWCLPGVPDAWNELLYALFLRRDFKARVRP